MRIHERALDFIQNDSVVGLGSGRAAAEFIQALAGKVGAGLRVRGLPTSLKSTVLAEELGIPLVSPGEVTHLDLAVDGADEVDPDLNLIKGYGGAMVREKIVASLTSKFVILVGAEKIVSTLGERGKLPVEVLPFGEAFCRRQLEKLGCRAELRLDEGGPWISDNGNHVLDCAVSPMPDPAALDREILMIPGVLGTGIFVGAADIVLIQRGDGIEERVRG